jgi:hypothetical protein
MAVDLTITADKVQPLAERALFTLPIIDNGWSPLAAADGDRQLARAAEERRGGVMKLGPAVRNPHNPKSPDHFPNRG